MSDHKALARRFLTEVLGAGRFDLLDELLAPGFLDRSLPSGLTPRMAIEGFRSGFPDVAVSVDHQTEEGETVISRWTARATHSGEFYGVPATGKPITMEGFSEYRFENDRMAEAWVSYDQLGLLQQLGAIPAPV